MKRLLLVPACTLLFSLPAATDCLSQIFDDEYGIIGIYSDLDMTSKCSRGAAVVWCRPSKRGMNAARFRCNFPSNVTATRTMTNNLAVSTVTGNESCGFSVYFNSCKTGWTWVFLYTVVSLDGELSSTSLAGECSSGSLAFDDCAPGTDWADPVLVSSNLLFNYPPGDPACSTAIETSSWGAIKAIYRSGG